MTALLFLALFLLALPSPAWGGSEAGIALDRRPELLVDQQISPGNRPELTETVTVAGPWRVVTTVAGVRTWETALPVRPRTLFFHRPPDGMGLLRRNDATGRKRPLEHRRGFGAWNQVNTWEFSSDALQVRRRVDEGPPDAEEYAVRYAKAIEREQGLNLEMSGLEPEEFVFRSLQLGDTTRHGLYVPAPSSLTFEVDIPEGAELRLNPGVIPSEAGDQRARPRVELEILVGDEVVHAGALDVGAFPRLSVPLSKYAGKGRVTLRTTAQDSALAYAFVADPVILVPKAQPQRVVMVFIDTLRQDHLSVYGYERDTTPFLASWAEQAAVFEDARSVAPWTLPSARAMVTGTQPEHYYDIDGLPQRLAERGWMTASVLGNVYLSSNFDMDQGWTIHRCVNWPPAAIQIDRALEIMDQAQDRPLFLQIHFMDPHLPYNEPHRYRDLFAGERPRLFNDDLFLRSDVMRAARKGGDKTKDYVVGRYDNNIRYVDDQLKRFFSHLEPDDLVIVLSDHGEEFWEHGGFEHGHTLYDELLRVPMIVRGKGIEPGRHDVPVSLLDVAPTVAEWTGLDRDGMLGLPLQSVSSEPEIFRARPQAVGRPLYGTRQWGVVHEGSKFMVHEGKERLFDLERDPGELRNLLVSGGDSSKWQTSMENALRTPVTRAWRVYPTSGSRLGHDLVVTMKVPAGIEHAWAAESPTNSGAAQVSVAGDTVVATWQAGRRGTREVFVVPRGDIGAAAEGLEVRMEMGRVSTTVDLDREGFPPDPDGRERQLFRERVASRPVVMTYTVVPRPAGTAVAGFDAEVSGDLESLGYVDDTHDE